MRKLILFSLGVLGLTAVMTQLALMRELLCVFNGNEMSLGIILGNWLLLTGIGTWLGRNTDRLKNPMRRFVLAQILIGLLPLAQVFAVRALRNVLFLRGAMPGLTETVVSSFLFLLPFCLVSGYLLALSCAMLAGKEGPAGIGKVYVADTVGSIVGGVVFSFLLIRWLDHFGLLCVPALLNFALAGWLAFRTANKILLGLAGSCCAGLIVLVSLVNLDAVSTALQYPQQQIVWRQNSPYGKLIVTQSAGQFNVFENGLPLFSTHNLEKVEETAHYAMAQRPNAARVLLVSGGISGTTREILKYGVSELTYVELDPLLLEVGRKFLPENLADPRIKIVNTDGRLFIHQTTQKFDVIIVDLPAPSTSQLNRFFTAEFFAAAKRVLTPDGLLSFGLAHYENYVGPELARLLASAHATLKKSFAQVLAIPGGRVFFLASDGPLTVDIAGRLEARGIPTQLVNRHYLTAMLTPDRLADVRQATLQPALVNNDFSPVLYYYQLRHWMSQFRFKFGVLEGILLALLVVYLIRLRAAPLAIFASGFAASALELVLLLGFQILCGSLYHQLGVMVTTFMAGLAIGGYWANRFLQREPRPVVVEYPLTSQHQPAPHPGPGPIGWGEGGATAKPKDLGRRRLARLAFAVAVFAAVLPGILVWLTRSNLGSHSPAVVQVIILALTFILALLVGAEFPLAGRVGCPQHAGSFSQNEQIRRAEDSPPYHSSSAEATKRLPSAAATASRIYTADLVGACLGALLASTLIIPLLGVPALCWATAGLNVIGGAAVLLAKANP